MEDLSSRIPVITRARGFRLYAQNGKRYLDLSLGNGRFILGHKPKLLVNLVKQVCDRGLLAELPSIYTKRLQKGLAVLFPGYRGFLLAGSLPELLARASGFLGRPLSPADIRDPLLDPESGKSPAQDGPSVWRPFSTVNEPAELLLPALPTGIGLVLHVMCVKNPPTAPPPPPPPLPPLLLAAAAHCLALLRSAALPDWYSPTLLAGSPDFIQKDIYLVPRLSFSAYQTIYNKFLDQGLVLATRHPAPSILPLELSPGELERLTGAFLTGSKGVP